MNVCLLYCGGPSPEVFQPLGLAYVAAALAKVAAVEIIDYQVESPPVDGWSRFDAIGISIPYTAAAPKAYQVADEIRRCRPQTYVFFGGPHAAACPEECSSHADAVIVGEAEALIADVLSRQARGIIKAPPIEDLDQIPFPARHLLPMARYFDAAEQGTAYRTVREPWATVITSRGCPHSCIFCSIHSSMGRKWRGRSPENVVDELAQIVRAHPVRKIAFEDDNLSHDPDRLTAICQLILQRQLRFRWFTPNGVRADTLDRSLVRLMAQSGCDELWFAPESGVQRVVNEVIGKRLDLSVLPGIVSACRDAGISPNMFFVIGTPGETLEEIKKTIAFAREMRRRGAGCIINIATPLPGTPLHSLARKRGYLRSTGQSQMLYNSQLYLDTPEFTAEQVQDLWRHALDDLAPATHASRCRRVAKRLLGPRGTRLVSNVLSTLRAFNIENRVSGHARRGRPGTGRRL